jgi:glycosyltransferase involved in cell wall biosynthesis
MENKVFFSIIIPSYNRADFIGKTLLSALSQTNHNYEIIVVDDGSTDNTEKVINEIKNEKIKYYKIKNSERGAARNFGASVANGSYLNFFDSDDLLFSNHIETASLLVQKENTPEVFHLAYNIVNIKGEVLNTVDYLKGDIGKKLVKKGNFLNCNGVFVRADIFKHNRFEENRALAGSEDFELWVRLASQYRFRISHIVTSSLVNHDERSVLTINEEKIETRILLLIEMLTNNPIFNSAYKKHTTQFKSSCFSYLSLHLAMAGNYRKKAFAYFRKSLTVYPPSLFSKRALVILKLLIFHQ